jgi:hypothetical protein
VDENEWTIEGGAEKWVGGRNYDVIIGFLKIIAFSV